MKEYYKAYEDRYKKIHAEKGVAWAGDRPSETIKRLLEKYGCSKDVPVLELGCGEGQNAIYLMENGYNILASDVSKEAIHWCKAEAKKNGLAAKNFFVMDALNNKMKDKFDFIYSVCVLHMLVLDEDRKKFLDFVHDHLTEKGKAFIVIMGDGEMEKNDSDITKAFELAERKLGDENVQVATTSCRIVSWKTFFKELETSNLKVLNSYIDKTISGFPISMVAEVERKA